jgi:hypothetical protein
VVDLSSSDEESAPQKRKESLAKVGAVQKQQCDIEGMVD